MRRASDLSTPRSGRSLGIHYDPEAFGRFSEAIARYLGTARYLVIQTVVVIVWIALNAVAWALRWDPYPFILLTLALSLQAAYAAPLILQPTATVAEALARLREPDLPAALAAQVFVVSPPTETPTGPYLGVVGFQQLLREPPSNEIGACVTDSPEPVEAELSEVEVAERLAAYNLLAVAVCDDAGRMLGAVTVDDVLDRTLPAGWRGRP